MRYSELGKVGLGGSKIRTKVGGPLNLLESELGEEVSELLACKSLQLNSAHQAWLLMAILYLVERERRVERRRVEGADVYTLAGECVA